MKTIKLTEEQFEQLKDYVVDSCEDIMEKSLDWDNSDFIDENEIIFEFRSILEEADRWTTHKLWEEGE